MFLIICKNTFLSNIRNTLVCLLAMEAARNVIFLIFMGQIRPLRLQYMRNALVVRALKLHL